MIKREFGLQKKYSIAIYARMSDKKQNKRSPDQQIATVKETISRLKCPWKVIKVYRDDGIKARYFKRRAGLQNLLRDIEAGLIQIDLIAVDTWERFGRREEFDGIRRMLLTDYGVMIVTADTNFADPTGVVGKAIGMIESVRSSEEGRVKSHNVLRGKRDALQQRRWPGGPTPFGYRLKKLVDNSGREPRLYSVLEHDPATVWIRRRLLQKAADTGWGSTRLAKWLNTNPEIPKALKPFNAPTIDYWLDDEINIGTYVWGENNTDIINDSRVIEPTANPDDIQRIEGFCEAIIDKDTFEKIQATRAVRKVSSSNHHKSDRDGKLIKPTGRGQSVKYPLSGLIICECGGFMNVVTSGRKSKTGTTYTYRACPRHNVGACENSHHIREDDLWKAVIARLRSRLFPINNSVEIPEWFPHLMTLVQKECDRLYEIQPDRLKGIREQLRKIDDKIEGWRLTLGSPALSGSVRADIIAEYEAARQEHDRLENELTSEIALEKHVMQVFDVQMVMDRLHKLDTILTSDNATLINVALSMHIERIQCYRDGRVVMRGTHLGLFEGGVELLSDNNHIPPDTLNATGRDGTKQVAPRRRARRHVPNLVSDDGMTDAAERCADVHRFDQLPSEFKWMEEFYIRPKMSWSEEYAEQIYKEWLEVRNITELARRHGKTTPTIRKALSIARKLHVDKPQTGH